MLSLTESVTSNFWQRKKSFSPVTPQQPSILMKELRKYLCVKKSIFLMSNNRLNRCFFFHHWYSLRRKTWRGSSIHCNVWFNSEKLKKKNLEEYSKIQVAANWHPAVKNKKMHQVLLSTNVSHKHFIWEVAKHAENRYFISPTFFWKIQNVYSTVMHSAHHKPYGSFL